MCLAASVGACAAIPRDGPSPRTVTKEASSGAGRYGLVDVTYETTQQIASHAPATIALLSDGGSDAPNDIIAPGDEISLSIFEAADGGLFVRSLGANIGGTGSSSAPAGAQAGQQALPRMVVDRDGDLAVPFGGPVHVAGLTPAQASDAVRASLGGKAVDPQVSLVVMNSRANTVGVIGLVKLPGHYPLAPAHDRLLDILETAGGATQPPGDVEVVVSRRNHSAGASLAEVLAQPEDNIRLAPHDEIRVLDQPRKFMTFGAVGHSSEFPMQDPTVTLAEALGRAGGIDNNSANSRWVMVFRFERPEIARALGVTAPPTIKGVPIVYRVNLRDPRGYFLAGNFNVDPNDLIYVARSDLTESRKFLDFVNTISSINYELTAQAAIAP
jgi:polysaccharide export outer membrane protein